MKKEIKDLLKKEIKEVNQSKGKVITGMLLLLLDIVLVSLSLLSIETLIFTLPLVFIIRKQIFEFKMKKFTLILLRLMVDEEFEKEFLNENKF
mgnify:CR=1 FL=1